MPNFKLNNAYCSLEDVHAALGMDLSDTPDDDRLILAINSASRQIDNQTNRRFWQDTSATARVYVATTPFMVEIDDVNTLTGFVLKTDPYGDGSFQTTWQSTDYQLEPLNAQLDGQPWVWTTLKAIRSLLFPVYGGIAYPLPYSQALIQVTAQWGWASIPDDIIQACVVQSIANFKAGDVPFGATAFGETGIVRIKQAMHPTAAALIEPYAGKGVLVA